MLTLQLLMLKLLMLLLHLIGQVAWRWSGVHHKTAAAAASADAPLPQRGVDALALTQDEF